MRNANGDAATPAVLTVVANYNKGFAARKLLLELSSKVNCENRLNRYSFFEVLEDKLLPNTNIELNIEFDKDPNFIWRQIRDDGAGNNYR